MYAYYGLSVFPNLRRFLWWKKFLTQFQLVSKLFSNNLDWLACSLTGYHPPIRLPLPSHSILSLSIFKNRRYIPKDMSPQHRNRRNIYSERNNRNVFLAFQLQFCTVFAHGIVSLKTNCRFPLWMQYACMGYMVSFLVLFANFYLHAYITQRAKKRNENGLHAEEKKMK